MPDFVPMFTYQRQYVSARGDEPVETIDRDTVIKAFEGTFRSAATMLADIEETLIDRAEGALPQPPTEIRTAFATYAITLNWPMA